MYRSSLGFAVTVAMLSSQVYGSILLRGGTIVTWNNDSQAVDIYRNASLLVQNDTIFTPYMDQAEAMANATEVVDATNKIIVPGFVSTHQHVWQTLYKTLIPDLPFAAYFPRLSHMGPISSTLNADDVYRSELMGALELLSEGTTSWVDVTAVLSPETVEAAWRATFESGGRSFFGAMLQNRENFTLDQQISQINDLHAGPELRNSTLVTLGLSYDGFDSSTEEDRAKVLNLTQSGSVGFITTHYVGGPYGTMNSPELLNRPEWSLLNQTFPIIFTHASYLSPLDASLLRVNNHYISIAPESEQHAGHGNPRSHLILDQAALAADSVFAFSTSLVHQARVWLQTVRSRLAQLGVDQWTISTDTSMKVDQAFYLATRAGALALRRPDLGIIAEGAKADLVMYDTTNANLLGWSNPIAAVMLHSNPGDISDVMVGGKFVKRNFNLTYDRYAELRNDFMETVRNFDARYRSWDFGELPNWFPLARVQPAQTVYVVRNATT